MLHPDNAGELRWYISISGLRHPFKCLLCNALHLKPKKYGFLLFCNCSLTPWSQSWTHRMRWSSWFWGTQTWQMTFCWAWQGPWRAACLRSHCSTSTSTSLAHMVLTSCWTFWEWSLRSLAYSKSPAPLVHIPTTSEKEGQSNLEKIASWSRNISLLTVFQYGLEKNIIKPKRQ